MDTARRANRSLPPQLLSADCIRHPGGLRAEIPWCCMMVPFILGGTGECCWRTVSRETWREVMARGRYRAQNRNPGVNRRDSCKH